MRQKLQQSETYNNRNVNEEQLLNLKQWYVILCLTLWVESKGNRTRIFDC